MKAGNAKHIWQKPIYLPYLQPELTNKMIQEAESFLGYKLPQSYLDLLKIQNGGYIRYDLKDIPHYMIYGIGPYFPNILENDWSEVHEYVSFPLEGLILLMGMVIHIFVLITEKTMMILL